MLYTYDPLPPAIHKRRYPLALWIILAGAVVGALAGIAVAWSASRAIELDLFMIAAQIGMVIGACIGTCVAGIWAIAATILGVRRVSMPHPLEADVRTTAGPDRVGSCRFSLRRLLALVTLCAITCGGLRVAGSALLNTMAMVLVAVLFVCGLYQLLRRDACYIDTPRDRWL